MKAQSKESPAMQLVRMVWDNGQEKGGHSWTRFNQSMHEAVSLAIRAGMRFDVGDFEVFSKELRMHYWGDAETFYSRAVHGPDRGSNMSACLSLEQYLNRKPWILASGARLYVGYREDWKIDGETFCRCDLTSMTDDRIVVVSNYQVATGKREGVEKRRVLTIKRERFDAMQRDARQAKKAAKEMRMAKKRLTPKQTEEARALPVDPMEAKYTITLTFDVGGAHITSDLDKAVATAWRALLTTEGGLKRLKDDAGIEAYRIDDWRIRVISGQERLRRRWLNAQPEQAEATR